MISDSLTNLIVNGNDGFPFTRAYKSCHRYYDDFIEMMNFFSDNLSESDYSSVENKVISGSSSDEQTYLQTMCELTVTYYVMRMYNEQFKYEPKYNGGNNPECSFEFNGRVVSIEVKCPNMMKRVEFEEHNTLKLFSAERIPKHDEIIADLKNSIALNLEYSKYSGIEEIPRMDNKLKDYLESAQKKFPQGEGYFNILAITLDIVQDVDEWYSYILGDNGVFTNNTYVDKNYDSVDAILLSTPVYGHRAWEQFKGVNVWHLEETINLLILDPRKEESEKGKFYFSSGVDLFGWLSKEFLLFQNKLDFENESSMKEQTFDEKYIRFKEENLRICSAFIESLKK
ncbi:MAG: hypothetical protein APF81_01730 [Desulfosporosinus sp. BRH_c37]|nr:MAG: hypothetical protein APF81_01730 [Desulfosporosinus sp. BRH_c37]